jgi:antitoxin component of RelBE/YafQ-DinJ toxin-antitoxin module
MMAAQPESFKMRLDPASAYQLNALTTKLGLPRATVVRLALRRFAESEGIGLPDELAEQGKAAA